MKEMSVKVFGGWNKDSEVRKRSSSGGIFSALAERIISLNGYVYGAALETIDGNI